MTTINVDRVFADGWDVELTVKCSTAMYRAILDSFSDIISYQSAGAEIEPDEPFSESIEAGIAAITEALNIG